MLVLHIGPHKTGTTYIQQNLFDARRALEAQGWRYPELGSKGLPGHHDLAHNSDLYIGEDPAHGPALAALGEEARAAGHNLIFSAEGFCRWSPQKFHALGDALGVDQIDLVYVLRDPLDLFYSHWGEEVKQGYSGSLPDRFTEHFNDPMTSRRLNPMVDLARLLRHDRLRLHALPYEAVRGAGADIYEHLCATVLDLPEIKAASAKPKNTSFPIELTEFLRVMTLIAGKGARRLEGRSQMRLAFTSLIRPPEQAEIVKLIKAEARDARRTLKFPSPPAFRRRVARQLINSLDGHWTLPVDEAALFPQTQERKFVYYDTYQMTQNPKVMARAAEVLAQISGALQELEDTP